MYSAVDRTNIFKFWILTIPPWKERHSSAMRENSLGYRMDLWSTTATSVSIALLIHKSRVSDRVSPVTGASSRREKSLWGESSGQNILPLFFRWLTVSELRTRFQLPHTPASNCVDFTSQASSTRPVVISRTSIIPLLWRLLKSSTGLYLEVCGWSTE